MQKYSKIDDISESKEVEEKRKKKKVAIIIILMLVLILITSCDNICRKYLQSSKSTFPTLTDGNISLIGESDNKNIEDALNEKVQENMVNISINTAITVNSKTLKADLLLSNKTNNHYSQFVEVFDSNGNLLYKSDLVPVGTRIDEVKFDKLPSVTNDKCIAYIYSVDEENQRILGKVGVNVRLVTK